MEKLIKDVYSVNGQQKKRYSKLISEKFNEYKMTPRVDRKIVLQYVNSPTNNVKIDLTQMQIFNKQTLVEPSMKINIIKNL